MLYNLSQQQWEKIWNLPIWVRRDNCHDRMQYWKAHYRPIFKIEYIDGYCEKSKKYIARISGPSKYINLFLKQLQ